MIQSLQKTLLFIFMLISLIFSFNAPLFAQSSKCFDKNTSQFTSWAQCLGGATAGTTVDPQGKTIINYYNIFYNNPLYTGFIDNFYMGYFNKEYKQWCSGLGWDCAGNSEISANAARLSLQKTTNRLLADIFFAIISIIFVIFVVKLVIAIMKYAAAGDSEEVVKTQKKVIRSMLVGLGIIIIFLIVTEIITNLLGLGNFWEVGFTIRPPLS